MRGRELRVDCATRLAAAAGVVVPLEISERLKLDYPDDTEMRASHETIYQSLFIQGHVNCAATARCLRSARGGRSAVGTLVERSTRLVLLLHLEHGRSADSVDVAMRKAIATLPAELRRSSPGTGAEMANHVRFTIDTGIPIYSRPPCSVATRVEREHQYSSKVAASHHAKHLLRPHAGLQNDRRAGATRE